MQKQMKKSIGRKTISVMGISKSHNYKMEGVVNVYKAYPAGKPITILVYLVMLTMMVFQLKF